MNEQRRKQEAGLRATAPAAVDTLGRCPTPAKVTYYSRVRAKQARRELSAKQSVAGLRPYFCGCGHWHLGNPGKLTELRLHDTVACAKKFGDGVPCAFPIAHRVDIAGRAVWLCQEHWLELNAHVARQRHPNRVGVWT